MSTHSKITTMPFFDKSTTNIIKGVALIMMLVHHLFTFPDYWTSGVFYPFFNTYADFFRNQFKICVPVFCFMTGYFYYFCKTKTYKYSLKKITDFLLTYWIVFLVFALISVFVAGYHYDISTLVFEAIGLIRPTMIFCWYVYFYLIAMLMLPLISKFMGKHTIIDLLIALLVVPHPINVLANYISDPVFFEMFKSISSWMPVVLVGYIFAEHRLYERIDSKLSKVLKSNFSIVVITVAGLILIPFMRSIEPSSKVFFSYLPGIVINHDVIYVPLFVYCIIKLSRIITFKYVRMPVIKIGEQSLLMWFVSCIFFNCCKEIFQPIIYFPKNPVLVTIWGLILTYLMAVAFDFVIKKIVAAKNKVFFK